MKILVVCQMYYPEQFLINDIAPALVKRGHDVTVLTGLPNYPEGKVPQEYKWGRKRNEVIDGVKVIRCFEIGRHSGRISLILNYLSFELSANYKARFMPDSFDVVLSYQLSPILMTCPAIIYKKNHNAPVLLYCLDIWPESAKAHVKNDKGFLYKGIAKFSRSIYQNCDKIAVTSEPFIEYMKKVNGIPENKLCYIPQHADDRLLTEDLSAPDNHIADFMFAGNLGHGQTIEVIVKAAGILKNRNDFKVHIVGDGSRIEALKELAKTEGVEDKVIFHGRYPHSEMHQLYKMADALLITLRGNNFVGNTMPGKLQVYMTTGKPIFGAINGAARDVIKEAECGACVASGDYEGLAMLMKDFIENPHNYNECGKKAREYFKANFTKEIYINRLETKLKNLTEKQLHR
jgi:glycosyltransferase involved in cell wall biosynthesis